MKSIILKSHEIIHLRDTGSVIAWRVVKPQPGTRHDGTPIHFGDEGTFLTCPYGRTGEDRWVKETFVYGYPSDCGELQMFDEDGNELPKHVWYRSDDKLVSNLGAPMEEWLDDMGAPLENIPWRSSIHMPRWASRFTVTLDVGVKRIQGVTEEEAIASGIEPLFTEEEIKDSPELADCRGQWSNYLWHGHHGKYGMGNAKSDRWPHQFSSYSSAVGSYSSLHESIHGQGSWDRNDYFWKITCTLKK